jgi:release factor glutamine methyltransferase
MTLRTALAQGAELLENNSVIAPRLTAEVLLGHAIHCDRAYFYAHPEQELREVEWIHYGRYLHERIKGKPTQYITKKQEFYGREFRVTPDVLIPRPETEQLVEKVLGRSHGLTIDVGTGSGAIAVTLAIETGTAVIATDLSAEALIVAKDNAVTLGARVQLTRADLLEPFADGAANLIVSNPPYVPLSSELQREVRDYEPHMALFAGTSGLDVYRRLIPEAQRVLKPGGTLALELGFDLASQVTAMVRGWANIQVFPDLAGIPRVLVCEKP